MTDHTHIEVQDDRPGVISNIIAVLAFIVVIGIVVWGLLHLAGVSTSWFTSLFPHSTPTLQVTAPKTATPGTPIDITWKYAPTNSGTYAFLYQCRDGVSLKTTTALGTTVSIPCGAAYTITATSSMTVTPMLTGTTTASLPLSVIFMPTDGTAQAQGTATIAIADEQKPAQASAVTVTTTTSRVAAIEDIDAEEVTAPVHTTKTVSHTKSYTPSAPADLAIVISDVSTQGGLTTVQFSITNVGGRTSDAYTFTASLPTADGYTYHSTRQYPLAPGDAIVNTLSFSDSVGGEVAVVINGIDAHGSNDADTAYAASTYTVPQYDYGYSAQTYYYPQQSYQYTYQPSYSQPMYTYPTQTYYAPQSTYDYGYGTYYPYDYGYDYGADSYYGY